MITCDKGENNSQITYSTTEATRKGSLIIPFVPLSVGTCQEKCIETLIPFAKMTNLSKMKLARNHKLLYEQRVHQRLMQFPIAYSHHPHSSLVSPSPRKV